MPTRSRDKTITLTAYILLILLGFGVYLNTMNAPFVWDDNSLIRFNPALRDPAHIAEIFGRNTGTDSDKPYIYYRPVQEFTDLVDYGFWKLDARGYHLTNILLHILTSICVFHFILLISSESQIALTASVLFTVHPVHTEAVSYVSGRGDLLAALFMLLALIFYLKSLDRTGPVRYLSVFLCAVLALFSKENAVILPVLVLGYHFCFRKRMALKNLAPVFLGIIVYFAVRMFLTSASSHVLQRIASGFERIPGFCHAFIVYIRLLVFPFGLHFDYGQRLFPWSDGGAILGGLALVSAAVFIIKKREAAPLICFSLLWFITGLVPYSNFYPLFSFMAEHNLYFPSVGFFILCVLGIRRVSDGRPSRSRLITAALVVYFASLAVVQNNYWRDPVLLYNRVLKFNPESVSAHNNLGVVYARRGEHQKEIASYLETLKIDPEDENALLNLGLAHLSVNDPQKAKYYFKKVIGVLPGSYQAYTGLGTACLKTGDIDEARQSFERAIDLKPDYRAAYFQYGVLYKKTGDMEKAERVLRRGFPDEKSFRAAMDQLKKIR